MNQPYWIVEPELLNRLESYLDIIEVAPVTQIHRQVQLIRQELNNAGDKLQSLAEDLRQIELADTRQFDVAVQRMRRRIQTMRELTKLSTS